MAAPPAVKPLTLTTRDSFVNSISGPVTGTRSTARGGLTIDLSRFTKLSNPELRSVVVRLRRQEIRTRAIVRAVLHEWWADCRKTDGPRPCVPRETFDTIFRSLFLCLFPNLPADAIDRLTEDFWRRGMNVDSVAEAEKLLEEAHVQYSQTSAGIHGLNDANLAARHATRLIVVIGASVDLSSDATATAPASAVFMGKREFTFALFSLADLMTESIEATEYHDFLVFYLTLLRCNVLTGSPESTRRILVSFNRARSLPVELVRVIAAAGTGGSLSGQTVDARGTPAAFSMASRTNLLSPNSSRLMAAFSAAAAAAKGLDIPIAPWKKFDRDDPVCAHLLATCIREEATRIANEALAGAAQSPRSVEANPPPSTARGDAKPVSPRSPTHPPYIPEADDILPGLEGVLAPSREQFKLHGSTLAIATNATSANRAEGALVTMLKATTNTRAGSVSPHGEGPRVHPSLQTNHVLLRAAALLDPDVGLHSTASSGGLEPGAWQQKALAIYINEEAEVRLKVLRKLVELRLIRERIRQVRTEVRSMGWKKASRAVLLAGKGRSPVNANAKASDPNDALTINPAAVDLARTVNALAQIDNPDRPPSPVSLRNAAKVDLNDTYGWQEGKSIRTWELAGVRPIYLGTAGKTSLVVGVGDHHLAGGGLVATSIHESGMSTTDAWIRSHAMPHYSQLNKTYEGTVTGPLPPPITASTKQYRKQRMEYEEHLRDAQELQRDIHLRNRARGSPVPLDVPDLAAFAEEKANSTTLSKPKRVSMAEKEGPQHRVSAAPIFVGSNMEGWRWEAYVAVNPHTGVIANTIPPLPVDVYALASIHHSAALPPILTPIEDAVSASLSKESLMIQQFVDGFSEPPIVQPKELENLATSNGIGEADHKSTYVTSSSRGYKLLSLGLFSDQMSAARAFDDAMRQAHGVAAITNFTLSGELISRTAAGTSRALFLQRPGQVWRKRDLPISVGSGPWDEATALGFDPLRFVPPSFASPRIFWPITLKKAYEEVLESSGLKLHPAGWIVTATPRSGDVGFRVTLNSLNARYSVVSRLIFARSSSASYVGLEDLIALLMGPPTADTPSEEVLSAEGRSTSPVQPPGASSAVLATSVGSGGSTGAPTRSLSPADPSGDITGIASSRGLNRNAASGVAASSVGAMSMVMSMAAASKANATFDTSTLPRQPAPSIVQARQRQRELEEAHAGLRERPPTPTSVMDTANVGTGWVERTIPSDPIITCLAQHLQENTLDRLRVPPDLVLPSSAEALEAHAHANDYQHEHVVALRTGHLAGLSDLSFQSLLANIPDSSIREVAKLLSRKHYAGGMGGKRGGHVPTASGPHASATMHDPHSNLATRFAVAGAPLGPSKDLHGRARPDTRAKIDPTFHATQGPDAEAIDDIVALRETARHVEKILSGNHQGIILSARVFDDDEFDDAVSVESSELSDELNMGTIAEHDADDESVRHGNSSGRSKNRSAGQSVRTPSVDLGSDHGSRAGSRAILSIGVGGEADGSPMAGAFSPLSTGTPHDAGTGTPGGGIVLAKKRTKRKQKKAAPPSPVQQMADIVAAAAAVGAAVQTAAGYAPDAVKKARRRASVASPDDIRVKSNGRLAGLESPQARRASVGPVEGIADRQSLLPPGEETLLHRLSSVQDIVAELVEKTRNGTAGTGSTDRSQSQQSHAGGGQGTNVSDAESVDSDMSNLFGIASSSSSSSHGKDKGGDIDSDSNASVLLDRPTPTPEILQRQQGADSDVDNDKLLGSEVDVGGWSDAQDSGAESNSDMPDSVKLKKVRERSVTLGSPKRRRPHPMNQRRNSATTIESTASGAKPPPTPKGSPTSKAAPMPKSGTPKPVSTPKTPHASPKGKVTFKESPPQSSPNSVGANQANVPRRPTEPSNAPAGAGFRKKPSFFAAPAPSPKSGVPASPKPSGTPPLETGGSSTGGMPDVPTMHSPPFVPPLALHRPTSAQSSSSRKSAQAASQQATDVTANSSMDGQAVSNTSNAEQGGASDTAAGAHPGPQPRFAAAEPPYSTFAPPSASPAPAQASVAVSEYKAESAIVNPEPMRLQKVLRVTKGRVPRTLASWKRKAQDESVELGARIYRAGAKLHVVGATQRKEILHRRRVSQQESRARESSHSDGDGEPRRRPLFPAEGDTATRRKPRFPAAEPDVSSRRFEKSSKNDTYAQPFIKEDIVLRMSTTHADAIRRAGQWQEEHVLEYGEALASKYSNLSKRQLRKQIRMYMRRSKRAASASKVRMYADPMKDVTLKTRRVSFSSEFPDASRVVQLVTAKYERTPPRHVMTNFAPSGNLTGTVLHLDGVHSALPDLAVRGKHRRTNSVDRGRRTDREVVSDTEAGVHATAASQSPKNDPARLFEWHLHDRQLPPEGTPTIQRTPSGILKIVQSLKMEFAEEILQREQREQARMLQLEVMLRESRAANPRPLRTRTPRGARPISSSNVSESPRSVASSVSPQPSSIHGSPPVTVTVEEEPPPEPRREFFPDEHAEISPRALIEEDLSARATKTLEGEAGKAQMPQRPIFKLRPDSAPRARAGRMLVPSSSSTPRESNGMGVGVGPLAEISEYFPLPSPPVLTSRQEMAAIMQEAASKEHAEGIVYRAMLKSDAFEKQAGKRKRRRGRKLIPSALDGMVERNIPVPPRAYSVAAEALTNAAVRAAFDLRDQLVSRNTSVSHVTAPPSLTAIRLIHTMR
jgi:hypothetical protein